ncbi:unnamed protein product [Rhizophagus irregularis]|nr:unnamed protein product [Rhizophagus irregularis]
MSEIKINELQPNFRIGANSPSLWPTILKYHTNYCTFFISFCKKGIRVRRNGKFRTKRLHDFRVQILEMSFRCLNLEY